MWPRHLSAVSLWCFTDVELRVWVSVSRMSQGGWGGELPLQEGREVSRTVCSS